MTIDLTDPMFHNEDAARAWLEHYRWPENVNCPHCGSLRVTIMGGKKHRPGLYHCPDCRGQFTVQTGTVMESSHVKLAKWVRPGHPPDGSQQERLLGPSTAPLHWCDL